MSHGGGRIAAPHAGSFGHTNHPASGSFGRLAAPVAPSRAAFAGGAFRSFPMTSTPSRVTVGPNGSFRVSHPFGTSTFSHRGPTTSTLARIVVGSNGYRVFYPTLGTSYAYNYGGYPYYGFGTGYGNFGYSLSYPPYGFWGSLANYGYGGYGYGGYGYGSGGYGPAVIAAGGGPAIITNVYPQPIPGADEGVPAPPGSATVTVLVPEGGQVWFDNTLTQKGGTKWVYTSPALEPGKTSTLGVKARWTESGKDRDLDLPVKIKAGDTFTIDVTKVR
jgi:uncharacterized protein (TIGR03000 family)